MGGTPRGQGAARRARLGDQGCRPFPPASGDGLPVRPFLCDRSLNPRACIRSSHARPSSCALRCLATRPQRGQQVPISPRGPDLPFLCAPCLPVILSPAPPCVRTPGLRRSQWEAEPRALAEGGGVEPESVAPWPAPGSACQHVPHPTPPPLTPSPEANSSLGLGRLPSQKT